MEKSSLAAISKRLDTLTMVPAKKALRLDGSKSVARSK
jgi:hypothetical protein